MRRRLELLVGCDGWIFGGIWRGGTHLYGGICVLADGGHRNILPLRGGDSAGSYRRLRNGAPCKRGEKGKQGRATIPLANGVSGGISCGECCRTLPCLIWIFQYVKERWNRHMTDFDGKDTTTGTLKARKKVCQTFFLAFYLWFSDLRHEKRKFLYRTFVFIVETQNFASLHPSTSQVVPKYFASTTQVLRKSRQALWLG